MAEIRAELSKYPVKTRLALTGPMVVARDIAHAKIKDRLDAASRCPTTSATHCVYYAGPAKGHARGLRVRVVRADHRRAHGRYVDQFQAARRQPRDAGEGQPVEAGDRRLPPPRRLLPRLDRRAGARLAQDCITKVEVLEYPELGMEAVWRIEVVDFPAFDRRRRQGSTTSSRTCLGR